MWRRRSLLKELVLLVAAAALVLGLSHAQTVAAEPLVNRVAFLQLGERGNFSLRMVNSDGSEFVTVANDVGNFAWSADGTQVAFSKDLGDYLEIYKVGSDGLDPRRLTSSGASSGSGRVNTNPKWDPSGETIAFESAPNIGLNIYADIFTISQEGRGLQRLTTGREDKTSYALAGWSADGRKLLLTGCHRVRGWCRVGWLDSTTGSVRYLTSRDKKAYYPQGSPDGTQIAYVSGRDIRVMTSSGLNRRRLTTGGGFESNIDWRRDGVISFTRFDDNDRQNVWLVNQDGSELRKLLDGDNGRPDWRSSDSAILIVRAEDNRAKLFVGDANAQSLVPIVDSGAVPLYPAWGGVTTTGP